MPLLFPSFVERVEFNNEFKAICSSLNRAAFVIVLIVNNSLCEGKGLEKIRLNDKKWVSLYY